MRGHNSAAPMAKALARMSALETEHKNEIARLRMELEESQKKCKELQKQLDVYQSMEKDQRRKSFALNRKCTCKTILLSQNVDLFLCYSRGVLKQTHLLAV